MKFRALPTIKRIGDNALTKLQPGMVDVRRAWRCVEMAQRNNADKLDEFRRNAELYVTATT
jgi:hypothetical protein